MRRVGRKHKPWVATQCYIRCKKAWGLLRHHNLVESLWATVYGTCWCVFHKSQRLPTGRCSEVFSCWNLWYHSVNFCYIIHVLEKRITSLLKIREFQISIANSECIIVYFLFSKNSLEFCISSRSQLQFRKDEYANIRIFIFKLEKYCTVKLCY